MKKINSMRFLDQQKTNSKHLFTSTITTKKTGYLSQINSIRILIQSIKL